ncbi:hypothetical protein V9T40_000816 [Parthenolecanium corni]|uniref:Uncharacterized protein n=1 Tax=Parthenolecanium corni TaxID=536013 RepID=A0AAN9TA99_9HEMI
MFLKYMDTTIQPCDDFYGRVCGQYKKFHEIPSHGQFFSQYTSIDETMNEIISDFIQNINTESPKSFQKAQLFYQLCMNEDKRRNVGYDTLQYELDNIGMKLLPPFHLETEPRKDFGTILGKMHRFSFDGSKFFHDVSVNPNSLAMQWNVLTIGSIMDDPTIVEHQNGGIPTNAIPGEEKSATPRREYLTSVIYHLYNYLEFELTDDMKSTIARRVNDVLNLEILLIMIRLELQDDNEVQRSYLYGGPPFIKAKINELLQGGEIQVNFYDYLLELFSDGGSIYPGLRLTKEMLEDENCPVMTWISDYHEFEALYKVLKETGSFVFGCHKFTESYIWWSAVANTLDQKEGPAQLSQYYKEYMANMKIPDGSNYFTPRFIEKMFKNIKKSYEKSIRETRWLDQQSKEQTLKKIRSMKIQIGFDNSMLKSETIDREYEQINIQPDNYFKSLATLYQLERKKELFKIFVRNDLMIPISTLEFPLYDLGLEALNYGITGFIIAHEVGHAMDVAGSGYDAKGNQKHCLTENSRKTFYEIIQRFIDTYNKYEVYFADREPVQVNGQISVNENMADWQGFNMALMAYKMYEKEYGIKPKLIQFEDLSPEKLFTLAFASEYCIMPRIGHVIRQATAMTHLPDGIRLNGNLKNSRHFSEVWGCADGSPMNPPDKCEIWF